MNHLQFETSPYLLQHATNPVDWYPWKGEAFRRAKEEDKPILVSIGYSTCHWCHVMERESFEDEAVAEFMNTHFINIKVDREERPDVDHIYMEACQAINGSGGWPLNAFLTPDRKPYYAGTYYPPESAYNRPSWLEVLRRMIQAFKNKREVVEEQADKLIDLIRNSNQVFFQAEVTDQNPNKVNFTPEIAKRLIGSIDREYGGFGSAPKFPGIMGLRYLYEFHLKTGDVDALYWVNFSIQKMVRGGIYDQLGGGLARYATDNAWLIPHFEKMLYDNALLLGLLADLQRNYPDAEKREVIKQTLDFLDRELRRESGGYFSALDADSEGEEGKFYVWDHSTLVQVLGTEYPLFARYFSVQNQGNWEGKTILWRAQSDASFAEANQISMEELAAQKKKWHFLLWPIREKRIRPSLDNKVLLSWNALLATAFAKVAKAFPDEAYRDRATAHLDFLLSTFMTSEGKLFHTLGGDQLQYDGFLEDYAFLIEALLEVYEIDFNLDRIRQAEHLTGFVIDHFLDEDGKFFYFSSSEQADVPLRKKEIYDSALPSGNSTMASNLFRLGLLTGNAVFRKLGSAMVMDMQHAAIKYPTSFARWSKLALHLEKGSKEVAIVGENAKTTARILQRRFYPGVLWMANATDHAEFPLLKDRKPAADTKIFICKDYACRLPVSEIEEAEQQLKEQV